ncbi:hypothetical protein DESC_240083 [Desulfosarcina cetonica]|nr:hypothetical protein DESC_240083 [Desulfosarcina cetonica]
MQFLAFENDTGIVDTTFFPVTYRRFCLMLDRYLLEGKVEADWGAVTLTVNRAWEMARLSCRVNGIAV